MKPTIPESLTDEQILKEFIKRFNCDGAILIYLDSESEFGFGAWNNSLGRSWVNHVFKTVKKETVLRPSFAGKKTGIKKYIPNPQIATI